MFSQRCRACGAVFDSAQPAITCSGRCRARLHRARATAYTRILEAVLATSDPSQGAP